MEKNTENICLKKTWNNSWKYRKKIDPAICSKIKENNELKIVEVHVVTKFFKDEVEGSIKDDEDDE